MGWYDDHILPHLIDRGCGIKAVRLQREKVVPMAQGDVLEVGFGSGHNLPWYDAAKVRRIWGLEPSEQMRRLARKRLAGVRVAVELIDLPGEEIPLEAATVDTIVVTYTLCTIPDVSAALAGMRRVLKPGGKLLYCEHGLAPDANVRRWQDRLNPYWGRFTGGCNLNRDIAGMLDASGFAIDDDNRDYIPGPRMFTYNYWGSAHVR